MPRRFAFVVGLVAWAFAGSASADLPPPSGKKFVGYRFTVKGIPAAEDRVLFAYPCASSGMGKKAHQKIEDGVPVTVGRRGGKCAIYSIAKRDYETFVKDYKPTNSFEDPALEALASRATACQGGVTLKFMLPTTDPRDAVEEILSVTTLTATACALGAPTDTPTMAPAPSAPAASSATPLPALPSATSAAPPPPSAVSPPTATAPASPPRTSSCAAVPCNSGTDGLFPAVLMAALVVSARTRRRRPSSPR